MKVTVFGAGYVGLVTGVCLAEFGHSVCCVDIDSKKIDQLQQGQCPIYEEKLEALLQKNLRAHRIIFTTDTELGIAHAFMQIIAVGTPPLSDGSADLHFVDRVANSIAKTMNDYKLIVNKSTVPVGTTDRVKTIIIEKLKERNINLSFDVVSNPEFLREGCAVIDFMQPNRVIVGADNNKALSLMRELYAPLIDKGYRFLPMRIRSAELTKYAANAFLATKISFMNEISQLAEYSGADITEIKEGMALDARISPLFLEAGCGFGGSCFPKDVAALQVMARKYNYPANIIFSVLKTNEQQQALLFYKVKQYFENNLENKVIALWGLAFKPNTDDIRCASSLKIMKLLWEAGAWVQAYDPMAMHHVRQLFEHQSHLTLCSSAQAALQGADALVIATEWPQFCEIDFACIKDALKTPAIFDGRHIYNPAEMQKLGFYYYGIGRYHQKEIAPCDTNTLLITE